ncbi:GNAT family N-acetyltransferase [Chitinophaga solisilvae]|uniref:GNAT family N-acetyltransferase n=1 Tax=Chitinophaga solisilvae TaxID=1233460 RepID=UPI00136AD051|nr:GNAT family N-acetyltransferase [Chitinophaga solisilvae]
MITITPIHIREHYTLMSGMMKGLHESELDYFHQTARWEHIAGDYMQHVISMQESNNGSCLLASWNGEPAGFIFGYTEEPDESRIEAYTGDTLYVSDGYVAPEFRRLGIYRALNAELEKIYIAQGIRRMVRYTLSNNYRMQQFLSSQQYEPVRIVYEKWLTADAKDHVKLFPEGWRPNISQ